jgi:hypothetical protein
MTIRQIHSIIFLFSETIPLRDIISCKKVSTWYSNSNFFYFEIIYKHRQVFRVKSEYSCYKWIEIINSAIIFSKFWSILMQKSSKVSEYFWQLNQEKLEIKWDERSTESIPEKKEEVKQPTEEAKSTNRNSMQSVKSKKERRKNPYTQRISKLI